MERNEAGRKVSSQAVRGAEACRFLAGAVRPGVFGRSVRKADNTSFFWCRSGVTLWSLILFGNFTIFRPFAAVLAGHVRPTDFSAFLGAPAPVCP